MINNSLSNSFRLVICSTLMVRDTGTAHHMGRLILEQNRYSCIKTVYRSSTRCSVRSANDFHKNETQGKASGSILTTVAIWGRSAV